MRSPVLFEGQGRETCRRLRELGPARHPLAHPQTPRRRLRRRVWRLRQDAPFQGLPGLGLRALPMRAGLVRRRHQGRHPRDPRTGTRARRCPLPAHLGGRRPGSMRRRGVRAPLHWPSAMAFRIYDAYVARGWDSLLDETALAGLEPVRNREARKAATPGRRSWTSRPRFLAFTSSPPAVLGFPATHLDAVQRRRLRPGT